MDINRLIQIANHFDKIGAYTVSDEFENKFIRTAAPVDKRNRRDQSVANSVGRDPLETGSYWSSELGRFIGNLNPFDREGRQRARQQFSTNLLETWIIFLASYLAKEPKYLSYKPTIAKLVQTFVDTRSLFKGVQSPVLEAPVRDQNYLNRLLLTRNDLEQVQKELMQFVDDQDSSFANISFNPYINKLHETENILLELRNQYTAKKPPASTPPASTPPASTPPASTPAASTPAASTPAASTPAKPGGSSSTGKTPTKPNQGSGGSKPSTKPTSKKPGKLKEDDAGSALSDIILRKYRDAHPDAKDSDILLGMRITESFALPTYYEITKDLKLDTSIRAAINDSPYSQNFKDTMLKIYESKLRAAKEKNEGPTIIKPSEPPKPAESPIKDSKNDDSDKKDLVKPDEDGFRCTREGLFTEIKRMDTLSENDPDKYMTQYFPNIKRVIDCHESIRNNLNLKDNTQIDVLINILESKYFSLVNKTQFPY